MGDPGCADNVFLLSQIVAGRAGPVPAPSPERESCVTLIPASLCRHDLAAAAVPVVGC